MRNAMRAMGCLAAVAVASAGSLPAGIERVLHNAVANRVFPGAAVAYGTAKDGIVGSGVIGNFTYGIHYAPATPGQNPAVGLATRFDLASLSKVVGATSAAAQFYQRGELSLGELVASPRLLGPDYAVNGKGGITVVELLTHSAGETTLLQQAVPGARIRGSRSAACRDPNGRDDSLPAAPDPAAAPTPLAPPSCPETPLPAVPPRVMPQGTRPTPSRATGSRRSAAPRPARSTHPRS